LTNFGPEIQSTSGGLRYSIWPGLTGRGAVTRGDMGRLDVRNHSRLYHMVPFHRSYKLTTSIAFHSNYRLCSCLVPFLRYSGEYTSKTSRFPSQPVFGVHVRMTHALESQHIYVTAWKKIDSLGVPLIACR